MSVAAVLVHWPFSAAERWLVLLLIACNGMLAWRCRAQLRLKPSGRWQGPTMAERRAAWGARLRVLYVNPSADPVVRAMRPAALALFACYLLAQLLEGIVIQSPYHSLLDR